MEAQAAAPTLPIMACHTLGGTGTILVVEDDEDVRLLMKDVLEGEGYSVVESSDGVEAVALFRQH
jgi:DNA-binding NtrC family response regulator